MIDVTLSQELDSTSRKDGKHMPYMWGFVLLSFFEFYLESYKIIKVWTLHSLAAQNILYSHHSLKVGTQDQCHRFRKQPNTKHSHSLPSVDGSYCLTMDIKVFQQNIINVRTPSCSLVDICVNCCQDHWTNAWVMDRRFQILIISSLSLNWQKFPHGASSRFPEWNGWTKWKHNASGPRLTPVWRVYSVAEWNCEWSFFGFALLSMNMQQMELSFYKMLLLLLIYLGCWWWKAWVENQNNEQTVFL